MTKLSPKGSPSNKNAQLLNGVFAAMLSAAVLSFARILDIPLLVGLFLIILYAYLKMRRIVPQVVRPLYLGLLFTLQIAVGYGILMQGLPFYFVPFCVIPSLSVLLFNNLEIAFLLALTGGVVVGSISVYFFYFLFLYLISGVLSALLIAGARTRNTVLRCGFLVGLAQVFTLLSFENFQFRLSYRYLYLLLNGVACSGLILILLSVLEYLFNCVTHMSLRELDDFNHPLLQRLMQEAPGTYHHSLIVGNLSDAACQAVGAHALLARVGAYYHDVGKLSKPDYFSENQSIKMSKHDALAPMMSKLVIMNHVKEGVELAQRYRLNPALREFIQRHHGTSLVYYFYRKALESVEDAQVREEGFRYPGPRPNTRETAIVLLADSVEAATRAMKDQAPAAIEEMVHKVINNKFIDGQLDECDLTLKDLEKISRTFIHILTGFYHSRVSYPGGERDESNGAQSAEEGQGQRRNGEKGGADRGETASPPGR